ncbi:MAG: hypothetical protein JSV77_05755 [Dehalococcoidales bacterium]|nr:MAG: hypothetical protein JSV77_05755 [Dehalococcoidales bacterium]
METQHIILLIINIVGGIAVIGSYIVGIKTQPGGANALWGGVPPNVRPVYGVSMVLSALGYFAFLYFILFEIVPDEVLIGGRFDFSVFYVIFLVILLPSALWMPLTNVYIGNHRTGIKIGVRIILALVGLASIALVWSILSLETRTPNVPYWLAVAGSSYFAFHTAILDGIIWSILFK